MMNGESRLNARGVLVLLRWIMLQAISSFGSMGIANSDSTRTFLFFTTVSVLHRKSERAVCCYNPGRTDCGRINALKTLSIVTHASRFLRYLWRP